MLWGMYRMKKQWKQHLLFQWRLQWISTMIQEHMTLALLDQKCSLKIKHMPSLMRQSQITQQEGWGCFSFLISTHSHLQEMYPSSLAEQTSLWITKVHALPTIKLLLIRNEWLRFTVTQPQMAIWKNQGSHYTSHNIPRGVFLRMNGGSVYLSSLKHMAAHWSLVRKWPYLLVWGEVERM